MSEMMEDISYLSREIGPRPAGTEEEQQAALYIADQIQKRTGFSATIEDFACAPASDIIEPICFGLPVLFSLLAMFRNGFAIAALLVAVVCAALYLLEIFDRPVLSRLMERGVSQNVVAKYTPGVQAGPRSRKVVIFANYDSGKVRRELSGMWPAIRKGSTFSLVALAVLWFIRLVFRVNPSGTVSMVLNVLTIVSIILALVPVITFIMQRTAIYNEAANHNASGVAAMMEVATRIANGMLSEEELRAETEAEIHGEDAAREAGLIPEGAEVEYEVEPNASQQRAREPEQAADRLAQAKAAVAALTGQPVREYAPVNEEFGYEAETDEPAFDMDMYAPGGTYATRGFDDDVYDQVEYAPTEAMDRIPEAQPYDAATADEGGTADEAFVGESLSAQPVQDENVPDWFRRAQQNARRDADYDTRPARRSRFADALDAAEATAHAAHEGVAPRQIGETDILLKQWREAMAANNPPVAPAGEEEVSQSVPEPVSESVPEPAFEPIPEPAVEPISESDSVLPVAEEAASQAIPEPAFEPVVIRHEPIEFDSWAAAGDQDDDQEIVEEKEEFPRDDSGFDRFTDEYSTGYVAPSAVDDKDEESDYGEGEEAIYDEGVDEETEIPQNYQDHEPSSEESEGAEDDFYSAYDYEDEFTTESESEQGKGLFSGLLGGIKEKAEQWLPRDDEVVSSEETDGFDNGYTAEDEPEDTYTYSETSEDDRGNIFGAYDDNTYDEYTEEDEEDEDTYEGEDQYTDTDFRTVLSDGWNRFRQVAAERRGVPAQESFFDEDEPTGDFDQDASSSFDQKGAEVDNEPVDESLFTPIEFDYAAAREDDIIEEYVPDETIGEVEEDVVAEDAVQEIDLEDVHVIRPDDEFLSEDLPEEPHSFFGGLRNFADRVREGFEERATREEDSFEPTSFEEAYGYEQIEDEASEEPRAGLDAALPEIRIEPDPVNVSDESALENTDSELAFESTDSEPDAAIVNDEPEPAPVQEFAQPRRSRPVVSELDARAQQRFDDQIGAYASVINRGAHQQFGAPEASEAEHFDIEEEPIAIQNDEPEIKVELEPVNEPEVDAEPASEPENTADKPQQNASAKVEDLPEIDFSEIHPPEHKKPTPRKRGKVVLPEISDGLDAPDTFKQPAPLAEETHAMPRVDRLASGSVPRIDVAAGRATSDTRRAALRTNIPSLSGVLDPIEKEAETNETVSTTGSFGAGGNTGAFAPVGDELVKGLDPNEMYVEDADDSAYEQDVTETGAFASPHSMNMPKSRAGRLFDRFRRSERNAEAGSAAAWLGVDEDFNPTEAGKERGDWTSFQEGSEYSKRYAGSSGDSNEDTTDNTEAATTNADDTDDASNEKWNGGAYSAERAKSNTGSMDPQRIAEEIRMIYSFRNPDVNTEVWFVALGSEQASNGGARAFLREHAQELRGAIFINLESMGAGTLSYVGREGQLLTRKPSSRLRRYLKKAADAIGIVPADASLDWRESIISKALRRNMQGMTLVGMDGALPSGMNRGDDVIENIDEDTLQQNVEFILNIVKNV